MSPAEFSFKPSGRIPTDALTGRAWMRHKLVAPVLALLRQGLTPEKLARSMAIGLMLGVTPLLGAATALCVAAALVFRLNLPAMQLVNYLALPLQIGLLIPFVRAGAWMLGDQRAALTAAGIAGVIRSEGWHAAGVLGFTALHALTGWLALGSIGALIAYVLLYSLLRRVLREE